MLKIYIASPLGFTEQGRFFLYKKLIPKIKLAEVEILDPWQLTPREVYQNALELPFGIEKRDAWRKANRIIGENNRKAIDACALMIACLDGNDVDSGTASEIGYAAAISRPVIGYRTDIRLSGDNLGALVNLQVEYFIQISGGMLIESFEQLPEAINKIRPR